MLYNSVHQQTHTKRDLLQFNLVWNQYITSGAYANRVVVFIGRLKGEKGFTGSISNEAILSTVSRPNPTLVSYITLKNWVKIKNLKIYIFATKN